MTSRAPWLLVSVLVFCSCAFEVEGFDTLPLAEGGPFNDAGGLPPVGTGGNPSVPPFNTGGDLVAPIPTIGTGGTDEIPPNPASCSEGTKLCGGICVAPAPQIGCTFDDCVRCPAAPAHSMPFCSDGQCSWGCLDGYLTSGNECVLPAPPATGGVSGGVSGGGAPGGGAPNTGGTTSGGGSTSGTCSPASCGPCSIAGPFPCCTANGRCGCSWVSVAYCL